MEHVFVVKLEEYVSFITTALDCILKCATGRCEWAFSR